MTRIFLVGLVLFSSQLDAQQQVPASKANYQLAARFSSKKLEKMIFTTQVDAHWLKKSTGSGILTRPPKERNGISSIR